MYYDKFDYLCTAKGVKPIDVSKATGISTATLSSWKNGKYTPKQDKLQKIADYFGVTIDFIMTESKREREARFDEIAKKLHDDFKHREALNITNDEWELLSAFRYLNKEGQKNALSYTIDLTWLEKYRQDKDGEGFIRF